MQDSITNYLSAISRSLSTLYLLKLERLKEVFLLLVAYVLKLIKAMFIEGFVENLQHFSNNFFNLIYFNLIYYQPDLLST